MGYNLNEEHNYKKTKQYPKGSVKITILLEEKIYGKLMKNLNPEKGRDKSKKGMPPPDW